MAESGRVGRGSAELARLFVAIGLNDATRKRLAEEQSSLARVSGGVKWVSPEMMHLTLVFLGDVFVERIAGVADVLDDEARATPVFAVEVAGLGTFGPRHHPRVIWAGIRKGAEAVCEFQGRIDHRLRALDLTPESRPFHPHFTLGRVKSPCEARAVEALPGLSDARTYGVVEVDRVLLMRSELHSRGPVHAVVHASLLKPDC